MGAEWRVPEAWVVVRLSCGELVRSCELRVASFVVAVSSCLLHFLYGPLWWIMMDVR